MFEDAAGIRRVVLAWGRVDLRKGIVCFGNLPAIYALISGSCPQGYDFAIPSSRLLLTMQTLGVAIKFVGSYAYVDFHHRIRACPSYKSTNHF